MQSESSLVAKSIERLAVRVLRRGGVIFALIEKRARLLPFEPVIVESDAIHTDLGRTLVSQSKADCRAGNCSSSANAGVDALLRFPTLQLFAQRLHNGLAHRFGVHCLGQNLRGNYIVIAIDNQSRRKSASLKTMR